MATKPYLNAAGKRVPSVTTVLRAWGDPGGLMHWANAQGLAGKTLDDARDEVATPGTIAHKMIDNYARGVNPLADIYGTPEAIEKAEKAFGAFLMWAEHSRLHIVESEVALVSEEHQFGGCMDALVTLDGEPAVADWKSGGKIYSKFAAQLGGYRILLDEKRPDFRPRNIHIIRCSGEFGSFEHHCLPFDITEIAKRAFLLAREMYDLEKTLKKVVGQ